MHDLKFRKKLQRACIYTAGVEYAQDNTVHSFNSTWKRKLLSILRSFKWHSLHINIYMVQRIVFNKQEKCVRGKPLPAAFQCHSHFEVRLSLQYTIKSIKFLHITCKSPSVKQKIFLPLKNKEKGFSSFRFVFYFWGNSRPGSTEYTASFFVLKRGWIG